MAKFIGREKVEIEITLQINESEARALEALSGYGVDEFIKVFYEKLGQAYMKEHEKGLRSFLKDTKETLPNILHRVSAIRKATIKG